MPVKEPRVPQSVNFAPWRDDARMAKVREAPNTCPAAAPAATEVGNTSSEKDRLQAELDGVLKFIAHVEQKSSPN